MNKYFDTREYFGYLLEHCTGPMSPDGEGRIAGARQLFYFLDQLQLEAQHRVLEIGCGTGRIMSVLENRYGVAPYGVDPCGDAINFLRTQRPDWSDRVSHVPEGVLRSLDSRAFDRIVFWGVFELTDQLRTLLDVSRIAAIGGRVLINGVRNAVFLPDDIEMRAAVDAYREKQVPIMLTKIEQLESLMQFLGFHIDDRYVFARKADVMKNDFAADRHSTRFAEATYVLTKTHSVPSDLSVAALAY